LSRKSKKRSYRKAARRPLQGKRKKSLGKGQAVKNNPGDTVVFLIPKEREARGKRKTKGLYHKGLLRETESAGLRRGGGETGGEGPGSASIQGGDSECRSKEEGESLVRGRESEKMYVSTTIGLALCLHPKEQPKPVMLRG